MFFYPGLPKHYVVDGSDGADAKPSDERDLRAQAEVQGKE